MPLEIIFSIFVDGGDIHAQPVVAVDVLVIQAVDLMLRLGLEGLGVVVHDEVLDHGAGLVRASIPIALGTTSFYHDGNRSI